MDEDVSMNITNTCTEILTLTQAEWLQKPWCQMILYSQKICKFGLHYRPLLQLLYHKRATVMTESQN